MSTDYDSTSEDLSDGASLLPLLPPSVVRALAKPSDQWWRARLTGDPGSDLHAAAWLAFVGASADQIVAFVVARPGEPERSEQALKMIFGQIVDALSLGQWVLDGRPPASNLARWRVRDMESKGIEPTGRPKISKPDLDDYVHTIRLAIASVKWKSRAGQTDRNILEKVVEIAEEAGTVSPDLPVRRLATMANCRPNTAATALQRLAGRGWLRKLEVGQHGHASTYLLTCPAEVHGAIHISSSLKTGISVMCSGTCTFSGALDALDLAHPAFHADGLRPTAYRLMAALNGFEPTTDKEWYDQAQVSKRAFYKIKPALVGEADGLPALALKNECGWQVVADLKSALDAHARHFGTDRLVKARSELTARERAGFGRFQLRRQGLLDSHEAIDSTTAVDKRTGEVVKISSIPDVPFENRVESVPGVALTDDATTSDRHDVLALPVTRNCEACGNQTHRLDPDTGLPWHDGCLAPRWIARLWRRRGVDIPERLIIQTRPKVVDSWGDDWSDVHTQPRKQLELAA